MRWRGRFLLASLIWRLLAIWEANVAAHEYGMSLLKPGVSCAEVTHKINAVFEERDLLK